MQTKLQTTFFSPRPETPGHRLESSNQKKTEDNQSLNQTSLKHKNRHPLKRTKIHPNSTQSQPK
uniref:Uncharacterized protein n=1 Tax=Octopus bimaculoides TaxID=37653 RepID=A0A0L8HVX0_OCTBM